MISIALFFLATYLLFTVLGFGIYVLAFHRTGFRPSTIAVYPPLFGCAWVFSS